jgi:1,2-phenylacetyl-CoA epoxidase catalytic subunit
MNPHQATQHLVASIVAVKFDLARIYTHWSVRGPKLEASTAVTAMAQEEAGHARVLAGLLEPAAPGHVVESLRAPIVSWPQMVGTAGPADIGVARLTRVLASCGHQQLRSRMGKMSQEEAFHEAFFRGWSELLKAESGPVERSFEESWARSGAEVQAWLLAIDELAAAGGLAESGQVARECNPAAFLESVP